MQCNHVESTTKLTQNICIAFAHRRCTQTLDQHHRSNNKTVALQKHLAAIRLDDITKFLDSNVLDLQLCYQR